MCGDISFTDWHSHYAKLNAAVSTFRRHRVSSVCCGSEASGGGVTIQLQPTEIDGIEHIIGTCIRISLHPDHGSNVDKLIQAADSIIYEAKSGSEKPYRVYSGTN